MATVVGYSDRVDTPSHLQRSITTSRCARGRALPYLTHPASVAIISRDLDAISIRSSPASSTTSSRTTCATDVRPMTSRSASVRSSVAGLGHGPRCRGTSEWTTTESSYRRTNAGIDYITRLGEASESARWVCAADQLHNSNGILTDLKRTAYPETVWARSARGADVTAEWYRRVCDRLNDVGLPRSDHGRAQPSGCRARGGRGPGSGRALTCCPSRHAIHRVRSDTRSHMRAHRR